LRSIAATASAAAFGCSWLRHHGSWTRPPDSQPHREEQQQQQQQQLTEQLDELSGSSSDDEAAGQQHLEPSAAAPGAAGKQSMLTVGGPAAREVAAAVKLLQSRAGLTAEEAEHVLYMATHFSSPRAHVRAVRHTCKLQLGWQPSPAAASTAAVLSVNACPRCCSSCCNCLQLLSRCRI
jgi:hypothetical protein